MSKQRGSISYMTPTIYALYYLKLKNNLGPQQILEAWKDLRPLRVQYYYNDIPHNTIKEALEKALVRYWVLNLSKPVTRAEQVVKFVKTYSISLLTRWFYRVNRYV